MPAALRMALARRPHTAAILDRRQPPPRGLDIDFVEVNPINQAFRRMVRDLEFDICEMAVVTHYLARAHGFPVSAIPVFVSRHLPTAAVEYNAGSGISGPADLAGTRVGSRSYTMTTAVWARGMLARQFGLDTAAVTWVVSDIEHVPGLSLPANVERVPGADLRTMLRGGELAAGIGLAAASGTVRPLWADTAAVDESWLARAGAVPVNHTVVIREDLLRGAPGLAAEIFRWFSAAADLGAQSPADARSPADQPRDPGPPGGYGLTAGNRACLELLLELTREQLPGERGLPRSVDDAFLDL